MGLAEEYAKYLGGSNRLLKDPLKEAKKVLEGASEEKIEKIKKMIKEDEGLTSEELGRAGQSLRKSKNPKKTGEGLKEGKGTDFGMLSVKAGIDNNPKPTQADRIVGATKKMKKGGIVKKKPSRTRIAKRGFGIAKRGY